MQKKPHKKRLWKARAEYVVYPDGKNTVTCLSILGAKKLVRVLNMMEKKIEKMERSKCR